METIMRQSFRNRGGQRKRGLFYELRQKACNVIIIHFICGTPFKTLKDNLHKMGLYCYVQYQWRLKSIHFGQRK